MTDTMYILLNGDLIPANEANLKVTDLSIQRGYGIFDFLKTLSGEPVFLDDHLNRFFSSAEQMRLPIKYSREEVSAMIYELIRKNNISESGIKITLTGGYSSDGFNIAEPNLIITQSEFIVIRDPERSISLISYNYQRQFATAKTLDYLQAIWLQPELKKRQADDVLYHDNGILRECPRANFFLVNTEGEILTPANDLLKGVSRKHILELISAEFKGGERDITIDDLSQAKEAFITSTTKNILPVTRIDGRVLGNGKPGEITKALARAYEKLFFG